MVSDVAGFRSQVMVHFIWLSATIANCRKCQRQPQVLAKQKYVPQSQKSYGVLLALQGHVPLHVARTCQWLNLGHMPDRECHQGNSHHSSYTGCIKRRGSCFIAEMRYDFLREEWVLGGRGPISGLATICRI